MLRTLTSSMPPRLIIYSRPAPQQPARSEDKENGNAAT